MLERDIMDGFFIREPYSLQIISKKKKYEFRNRKTTKLKIPFYLLTNNNQCIGIILFEYIQELDQDDPEDWKYAYKIKVIHRFHRPRKYYHPKGAITWIKNVRFQK